MESFKSYQTSPTTSNPSPTPSSPSPEEGSVMRKMAAMGISDSTPPKSTTPASAPRSADSPRSPPHTPTLDANTQGLQAPNGSPKPSNIRLDPRSSAFQPAKQSTHGARLPSTPPEQMSHSKDTRAQVDILAPERNNTLWSTTSETTPPSSRTYTSTTPSSTVWTPSASTVYTPSSSNIAELEEVGLDKKLNQALGLDFANHRHQQPSREEIGRWLIVTGIPTTADGAQIQSLITDIAEYRAISVKYLRSKGWAVVAFWDAREAAKVHSKLAVSSIRFNSGDPLVQVRCRPITKAVVQQLIEAKDWEQLFKDSEAVVRVQVNSPMGMPAEGFQEYLTRFGDLKSFRTHDDTGHLFTAEFHDSRSASATIRTMHNLTVSGGTFHVSYISDDPFLAAGSLSGPSPESKSTVRPWQDSHSGASFGASRLSDRSLNRSVSLNSPRSDGRLNYPSTHGQPRPSGITPFRRTQSGSFPQLQNHADMSPTTGSLSNSGHAWQTNPRLADAFASATDRPPHLGEIGQRVMDSSTLQTMLDQMDMTARARQQRQGSMVPYGGSVSAPLSPTSLNPRAYSGWPQKDRQAIPPENVIYPERIAAGLDTRTSVMIKDVPNKLSRDELVDILNSVVPREFDFVYLRFDFNNHCNVGYAFVNFTSTRTLYEFYQARVGKRWNLFSSEKILQMSYANIQGKKSLVDKFRNSAVMDVLEEWRPLIFYTDGAHKGEPEPFPPPDNPTYGHRATSARLSFLTGSGPSSSYGNHNDYDYPTSSSGYGF